MNVIKDILAYRAMCAAMYEADVIFLDLETTGFDARQTEMLLGSFHFGGQTYVVDFLCIPVAQLALMRPVLESEHVVKVLHNAVFDWQHFYHHAGIFMRRVYCTMIAEQVIKAGLIVGEFSLKEVAYRRLGLAMNKAVRDQFIGRDMSKGFTDEEYKYAGDDAWALEKIYAQQQDEIAHWNLQTVIDLEMDIIPVTAQMEFGGICVDADRMRAAIPVIDTIIDRNDLALQDLAISSGFAEQILLDQDRYVAVNSGSNPQMLEFVRHFGIEVPSLGKKVLTEWDARWQTGKVATNDEAFASLTEDVAEDDALDIGYAHPVLRKLALLKATEKIKGTYLVGLLDKISPVTNRIHGRFNQCGAGATGRFSSNSPNLQNLPNATKMDVLGMSDHNIRSMLMAAPGRTFIISDYAGIELSILAAMSGDETLIEQILLGDVHSYVGTQLFNDEIARVLGEPITKKNRKLGRHKIVRDEFKRVSYAICYGSTSWTLFRTCSIPLATVGIHITQEIAEDWVTRWKTELFPKTGPLFEANAHKAVTQYYTESLLGRKRHWNAAEVRTSKKRFFGAMREGMNQPIQSTSADMTKLAMRNLDRVLDWERARLVACVHDELLVEADHEYAEEAAMLTKDAMETAGHSLLVGFPKGLVIAEPKLSNCYDK